MWGVEVSREERRGGNNIWCRKEKRSEAVMMLDQGCVCKEWTSLLVKLCTDARQ